MLKKTTITVEKFDSDNKEFLTRLKEAMNEADFPFYVSFEVCGDESYSMHMDFIPKKEFNDTLDALMQNSTDHEYDIEELKNDVRELNTVVNKNSVDIDTLKEKIYVKSNDINNLNNDIENLNNKVRIVEKAIGINMKDIDSLLDKSDIYTQDIKNLKAAISRLEKQQYEIMKSINRIEALEERCKHNLNGLEAIDRRVKTLEE